MSRWRFLIVGPVGCRPQGLLYPENARKFDVAEYSFLLEADQRLPRMEPGGIVEAFGPVDTAHRTPLVADGVKIAPADKVRPESATPGRMLVERGDVIAHPAIVGAHPGWRYVESHSFDGVEAWSAFIDRRYRNALASLIALVLFLVLLVALIIVAIVSRHDGSGGGGGGGAGGGAGAAGAIGGLLLAIRARRALRAAKDLRVEPAKPMCMELWWGAGHGHGPVTIASLMQEPNSEGLMRVPMIGLPESFLASDEVRTVDVRGLSTDTPLIEVNGVVLWPAERARYRTADGWAPAQRRQRHGAKRSATRRS